MVEELLEKIPPEKRWAITTRFLSTLSILRGSRIMPSVLGMEEGVLAPVWGWEKWVEIHERLNNEGAKIIFPWVKERFNIPVEDALGAAKLNIVVAEFFCGPEQEYELIEATKEKTVDKTTKCIWHEMFNEFEVDPELRAMCHGCEGWVVEGIKSVNPKIAFKLTKAMPRGDSYCEFVFKFKEE